MRCAYQAYKVVQYTEFTSFGRPDKAYSAAIFLIQICISFDTDEKRR